MDLKQMEREVKIAYQARSRRVDVENELRQMAKDCIGQTLQNQLLALAAKLGVAEVYRDSELDKYELIPIDQAVTRLSGAQVAATPASTPSDYPNTQLVPLTRDHIMVILAGLACARKWIIEDGGETDETKHIYTVMQYLFPFKLATDRLEEGRGGQL